MFIYYTIVAVLEIFFNPPWEEQENLDYDNFKILSAGRATAENNFVQIKKQTLYGHNTARTGPFGVIYGSIC